MNNPSQQNSSGQAGPDGTATGPDDQAIGFLKTVQSLTNRNMLLIQFGEARRQVVERIDERLEELRGAESWNYADRSRCKALLDERETALTQCLNMIDLQQSLATEIKTYERDVAAQESGASEFLAGMLSLCMQEAVSLRYSIERFGKGFRPILETEAEKAEVWRGQLREMTGSEPEPAAPPAKKFLPN